MNILSVFQLRGLDISEVSKCFHCLLPLHLPERVGVL